MRNDPWKSIYKYNLVLNFVYENEFEMNHENKFEWKPIYKYKWVIFFAYIMKDHDIGE